MFYVRKIDENGLFVEDDFVEELTDRTIESPIPNGMYAVGGITPKWVGEWVEVVARPEINTVVEKTPLEILQETVDTLVLSSLGVL